MPWFPRCRPVVIFLICFAGTGFAQQRENKSPEAGQRAVSRVALGKDCWLNYAGAFLADGSFKGRSRLRLGELVDTISGKSEAERATPAETPAESAAPTRQRVVEDYAPGAHPVETVNGRPVLADLVDAITSFGEEHAAVMNAPQSVTTDSRGRVIIADPPAHAVHVLDYKGKTSFRIQGGKGRRLQMPVSVAADSHGNIYVSDAERGMILVYDFRGRFRHYMGRVKGEAFFERPAGIAIDSRDGRIYVADTAHNAIFILDLHGDVLGEIGGHSPAAGKAEFKRPTAVVLRGDQLLVLDSSGSRVQVMDVQGNLRRQVKMPTDKGAPPDNAGLGVDSEGNLYVSDDNNGLVRVYNQEGKLLNTVGRRGSKIGEFSRPTGIWADQRDRIYVADANNRRVQVFHLRKRGHAATCR